MSETTLITKDVQSRHMDKSDITKTKTRVESIDIARGIAIICIILGHLGENNINHFVFTFHVPIFFVISGYFISTNRSFSNVIKKKAHTLLVPYFLSSLGVMFFAALFTKILYPDTVSAKLVIWEWCKAAFYGSGASYTDPWPIKHIGAIWFLLAMFWGSCIMHFILKLNEKFRMILVLVTFFAGYYSAVKLFWFPLSVQAGMCSVLYMYIGFLVRKYSQSLKESSNFSEGNIAFTFGCFIVWFAFIRDFQSFWLVSNNFGRGTVDIIGSLCACYCIILISRFIAAKMAIIAKFLAFLGRYSIFVLFAHIIELDAFPWQVFLEYLHAMSMPAGWDLAVRIILKLVWSISITVLCTRFRWIKRIFGVA